MEHTMENTLHRSAAPFSLTWQQPQHYLTVQATAQAADTSLDLHMHLPGFFTQPHVVENLQIQINALKDHLNTLLRTLEPGSRSLLTAFGSRSNYAPYIIAPKGKRAVEYTLHTGKLHHTQRILHSRHEFPQHTEREETVQHIVRGLRSALDMWLAAVTIHEYQTSAQNS